MTTQQIDKLLEHELITGPIFRSFAYEDRRAMLQDDLFAGRVVTNILMAIVTVGMLMMLLFPAQSLSFR